MVWILYRVFLNHFYLELNSDLPIFLSSHNLCEYIIIMLVQNAGCITSGHAPCPLSLSWLAPDNIQCNGVLYSVQHFVCAHCEKAFEGRRHFEKKGQAYCERDYKAVSTYVACV